ncbi:MULTISPECIES: serine hydrolase [Pseudomonas]|uniref:serine hydrolase domain-containing protein n=1 Tax=Pseudomonas TaxID=286 RepID=UPI000CFC7188|nr:MULTISPECIES: serine hydrolase domain-containing protein [Pseudomonas]PQZ89356.1 serine hydrolase [Pseudomonas trivialis]PRB25078.1 serine hydrolase [Pseudomonas sp. MYb60]
MLCSLISKGQPQTPDRLELTVPWWSFTKTVLAATALTLVRDGLIGLDEPLADQPFTLRQLLRHDAGLADYAELADYHAAVANHESAWPADAMMQRLDVARLRYSPGTGWRYSNVGYLLIGRLIEQLTDLTLDAAVHQRALSPLGLSNVRFAHTRADLGSTSDYDPAWVYHGLLIGPVSQAALCLDRLLGGDLLSQNLIRQMQTARTVGGPIPGRPWITPGYGLGVMQGGIEGGYSMSGHTGCGPGSVIAVYRMGEGDASACCAVFEAGGGEGDVEARVVGQLVRAIRELS